VSPPDCSGCDCGCNLNGCIAPKRCGSWCAKTGGSCGVCGGCEY
jgi:hypothetical protein